MRHSVMRVHAASFVYHAAQQPMNVTYCIIMAAWHHQSWWFFIAHFISVPPPFSSPHPLCSGSLSLSSSPSQLVHKAITAPPIFHGHSTQGRVETVRVIGGIAFFAEEKYLLTITRGTHGAHNVVPISNIGSGEPLFIRVPRGCIKWGCNGSTNRCMLGSGSW